MIALAREARDPTIGVTPHSAGIPRARLGTRPEPHRSDCGWVCWRSETVSSPSYSDG